jgi:hypothetical protein
MLELETEIDLLEVLGVDFFKSGRVNRLEANMARNRGWGLFATLLTPLLGFAFRGAISDFEGDSGFEVELWYSSCVNGSWDVERCCIFVP